MNDHPFVPRRWFFEDSARVTALKAEAESWIGTPFRAHSKAKGRNGGVACMPLCEAIFVRIGLVEPFNFPRVSMDYSLHQERSIILEFLRGEVDDPQSARLASIFEEVWTRKDRKDKKEVCAEPIIAGDLLAFTLGKAVHHIGIALDATQFIHAFQRIGTVYGNLSDSTYARRLHSIFRARA